MLAEAPGGGSDVRYVFGDCELDALRHCLLVQGDQRTVEPQVFDLLHHMIENPGRVITHDELIKEIWNGRIVSDSAISARISAARAAIGDDGKRQAMIKTVPRRGFQFIAEVRVLPMQSEVSEVRQVKNDGATDLPNTEGQLVRFSISHDGTNIAFATTGKGYPLVRAGHWLTHLEHDWHSPIWRPFLNKLGENFQVTRYDQRGNGLSEWSVEDFSLSRCREDLEAVVDAAGIDRFALYGTSQGAPISIAYAAQHPERVSHLILHGGYAVGRLLRDSVEEREKGQALLTLIRHNWGQPGTAFIKSFASMYIPDASMEQIDSLADLQRVTTSPSNAEKLRAGVDSFDVSGLLEHVSVPTFVIHARNDAVQPLEQGRKLASGIRDAEFLMLDSGNHAILEHERAWHVLFAKLREFVLN